MSDQDLRGKFRVTLSVDERESLLSLVKKGKVAARKIVRARILLLSDEGEHGPGKSDTDIFSQSAQQISSEETMHLLSRVRMGVNLGLIGNLEIPDINQLFIRTQPTCRRSTKRSWTPTSETSNEPTIYTTS